MRMLAMPFEAIALRAEALVTRLRSAGVACDTVNGASTVGGGSLPGETLQTRLVRVEAASPDQLLAALRHGRTVVIARIADDRVCLDPRTVAEGDDDALAQAVVDASRG
jgi:L-seryl-tRNA(Ser) seleniumtransferase